MTIVMNALKDGSNIRIGKSSDSGHFLSLSLNCEPHENTWCTWWIAIDLVNPATEETTVSPCASWWRRRDETRFWKVKNLPPTSSVSGFSGRRGEMHVGTSSLAQTMSIARSFSHYSLAYVTTTVYISDNRWRNCIHYTVKLPSFSFHQSRPH